MTANRWRTPASPARTRLTGAAWIFSCAAQEATADAAAPADGRLLQHPAGGAGTTGDAEQRGGNALVVIAW
ncbi:hypothetical protein [Streptomyces albipurpureus]|uniref:Uncharacterized protein n=1 Tax=Streptomyces albipurpureus TaxID=2897419 RepID=A0ABT0UYB2_9ACTN|nr:hypothetical protein [Streptomyces sp. CWNU-1]MCM2393558.1 hypothetical protein [Streptomyces sp. CWNU-1]